MRIIAGTASGLNIKIATPARPYLEKVRGAIFNSLFKVANATVLDLYAGSGALGMEAISRGATSAVFVDGDNVCAKTITENLVLLNFAKFGVVKNIAVDHYLPHAINIGEKFSLIFIDPPFAENDHQEIINLLTNAKQLLTENGRIVFRREIHRQNQPLIIDGLTINRDKNYGRSQVLFFTIAGEKNNSDSH